MTQITAKLVRDLRERTGVGMMDCKKALVEADGHIEKAIENLRRSSSMDAAKKASRTTTEGVVILHIDSDNKKGLVLEINSETDFVARDDNFYQFANYVADMAASESIETLEQLHEQPEIALKRNNLVQTVGENISIRRLHKVRGALVSGYVHTNNKVAALVTLTGGTPELAKDIAMQVVALNPLVAKAEDMPKELVQKEEAIYLAQAADSGKPAAIVEKIAQGRLRKFLSENSLVKQPFVKNTDLSVGQLLADSNVDIVHFVRYEVGEGIDKKATSFAEEVAQLKGD